ncbi:hypothetical protein BCh11DRAFT_01513 [Burkholderia sp. Ch1-1]|uniref:Uncharacterized protein n=1 Tax=Paraburkholderia dioscoreae TaxID=2604047 RepID=A0A5Q4ZTI9_9BURK|nr:hypothetical protein [Paraburkholderia dioscoreae]EIF33731.1 hypothetical protein BCh11DRAFT_01513 [Burkholderia sp. Ch1-1]VVD32610.1 conserved protein of unknown function [Paraburkholderia dioscoreae]
MSAPESSNSKAPPSLLSDKAKGADGNGSRILANLEGRVAPPAEKSRRPKATLLLVALLVIAAGGWGAWHMQGRVQSESLAAATAAGVEKAAAPAAAASGSPEAPAAASSQAATIVADDSDSKAATASATASASGDGSRLSRALADGAEPSSAPLLIASATAASAVTAPAAKHGKSAVAVAGKEKHESVAHGRKESTTAGNRHASAPTAVAQSKNAHANSNASKDDSDADLLAALVARTKPADTKTAAADKATKVSASATGNAKLAERVKECGQRGFFEDQLCRWRVCDGHWGKDPACPGSAQQARQP